MQYLITTGSIADMYENNTVTSGRQLSISNEEIP